MLETGRLEPAARRLFSALNRHFEGKPPYQNRLRIRDAGAFFETCGPEIEEIKGILDMVSAGIIRLAERLRNESGWEEETAELDARIRESGSLVTVFDGFIKNSCTRDVLWCESAFKDDQHARLGMAPIEVGERLRDALWNRLERCVLTSATLAVGESFDYILGRMGLNNIEPERVTTRKFGSPFDFNEQLQLLVPTYLPSPKDPAFARQSAALIQSVLTRHARGTLILFTSHAMLREVYAIVRPELEKEGTPVLGQGIDGSFGMLARLFRDEEKSVLLGTNSFWEGVDFPGSTLELLIITKIPFDVPTDPLIEARMEAAQKNGGSGFMNYTVPEAIVRFRQGFGRLIRARTDRGTVLVLDKRIVQSEYGRLFRESLPVKTLTCDSPMRLLSMIDDWFGENQTL
jgi:ATP-dependent DNA helicase DinG